MLWISSCVPADPKPPLNSMNSKKAFRMLHRHMMRLSSGISSIRYFLFCRMKVMPLSTLSSNSLNRCSRADSGISFGSLCSQVFTYGRQPRSTGSCGRSGATVRWIGRSHVCLMVDGWREAGKHHASPLVNSCGTDKGPSRYVKNNAVPPFLYYTFPPKMFQWKNSENAMHQHFSGQKLSPKKKPCVEVFLSFYLVTCVSHSKTKASTQWIVTQHTS